MLDLVQYSILPPALDPGETLGMNYQGRDAEFISLLVEMISSIVPEISRLNSIIQRIFASFNLKNVWNDPISSRSFSFL